MAENQYTHLLYRRQFFYGPQPVGFEGWNVASMPGGNFISSHPSLQVTRKVENGFQVTLIGFILDPVTQGQDNAGILEDLCKASQTIDQFIEATEAYGGRWAMIVSRGDRTIVFNDAAGTRTIYFHFDHENRAWLASQPGLLADRLGFVESDDSQEFRASPEFQKRTEIWWPGDVTPFDEVRALLPNHLLDLNSGEVKRYWPVKPLQKISFEEGTRQAAGMLKGILAAAHARYPMVMSLSSGLDSRTVFAACKDFAREMPVFSMKYRHLTDDSDDIRVPREISQKLGLEFQIFDTTQYQSEEFRQIFNRNVVGLKTDWSNIAECRYANLPADSIVLKGSISEIMRCRYWSVGVYPRKVDLEYIINLMAYVGGRTEFVQNALSNWLVDAQPAEKYGYKLLDLLSWEIEVGRWYSLGQTLFDIAGEDFTAFNCRRFYNTMLGIDPKYRSYPYHAAQREIVRILWPELAEFPYTPSRALPKKTFRDTQFFDLLRSAKKMIRK